MGNSIFEKAAEFLKQQRKQHKWLSIVSGLAVIVALCTVIVLIMPGQAMTDQADCLNGTALTEEETAPAAEAPVEGTPTPEAVPVEETPAPETAPAEETPAPEDVQNSEAVPSDEAVSNQTEDGTDTAAAAEEKNNSPEALPGAEEGLLTQTFSNDEAVFTATYTKEANLPEDAKFIAEKQELDPETAKDAPEGMLRYNIGFYVNGVEVEPAAPVNISIKFIKGDFADADSIKVIHYVPQGTEKIDAEANTNNEGHMETDFNMNSFSVIDIYGEAPVTLANPSGGTFRLRYTYYNIWGTLTNRDLTIHCVDTNGRPIAAPGVKDITTAVMGKTFKATDLAPVIDGYSFKNMHWGSAAGTEITSVKTNENFWSTGWSYDKSSDVFKSGDVYLVYQPDGSGGSSGGGTTLVEPTLTHEKYVSAEKADGSYDLTLSVSSTVGSITSKTLMDVVIVIDKSNSMNTNGVNRMTPAKNAANSLIDTINGKSDVIDARYNIIEFSAPDDWTTQNNTANSSWSNGWVTAPVAKNNVNGITVKGGTNYQAAMEQTKTQLRNARAGAQTVVVFLTDGQPTSKNGTTSSNSFKQDYVNAAVNSVNNGQLKVSYFYALGIGEASDANLRNLTNAVTASTKSTQILKSPDQLKSVFEDIGAQVTQIPAKNVSVTDVLSDNVALTDTELRVVVKDKDGQIIPTPSDITAAKSEDGKTFYLNFPAGYELEDGVTYAVVANIQPTEQAYAAYAANNNSYPDIGDKNTGATSDGQPGLFSNTDDAEVTYSVEDKSFTEKYPKPVIQIHPQADTPVDNPYIDVSKRFTDVDALTEASAADFTITVTDPNGIEYSLKLRDAASVSDDGLFYTWHLENLSALGNYMVKESGLEIDGYDFVSGLSGDVDVTVDGASVAVAAGGVTSVTSNGKETSCSSLVNNVGEFNYLVCSLTDGNYIVWTAEHLSTAQRQDFINKFASAGSGKLYNIGKDYNKSGVEVKFFSGDTLNDKIIVKNGAGTVQYVNGKLNFSGHNIWQMFAVGSMQLSNNQNGDISIVNTYRKIVLVKVLKVANENPDALLEGASFNVIGPENFTGTTWTSGSDGLIYEGQLQQGDYTLTETAAPAGYLLLDKTVTINVSGDSTAPVAAGIGEGKDYLSLTVTQETDTDGSTIYKICIPNSAGVEMPHTGGSGNRTMMMGLSILLGGMLYGFVTMRRRHVPNK